MRLQKNTSKEHENLCHIKPKHRKRGKIKKPQQVKK